MRILPILLFAFLLIGCKQQHQTTVVDENKTGTTNLIENTTGKATSYRSKKTKSDKRKYYDTNDQVIYEVKYKSEGFKLRTPSSNLLWKIKLYDDKIKISDNEENLNPFEIKIISKHEAKLVKDGVEIGRIKYDAALGIQQIKDDKVLTLKGKYTPSLLVDMISEIPEIQGSIIKDELARKGY